MRALFTIDAAGDVVIDPAAYGISSYRKIWERDKTKTKSRALSELGYMYYMNDYKSYFSDIPDRIDKHNEVVKMVFPGKDTFEPDKVLKEAIELYKKDVPFSVGVLEDAKIGVEALRKYFRKVDLTELTDKGALLYDAAKLKTNLAALSTIMKSITELEQQVKQDVDGSNMMAGGREKGMFEDAED